MSWDNRWMDLAGFVAHFSKDRSRKTSAVIVNDRQDLIGIGWNGFPRGLNDDVPCRHERPAKYQWTEHAERNAIYNCAAHGTATRGCRIYMPWYPCADCARAIIQAGIVEIIAVEPDWDDPKFGSDFKMVREMLGEARIPVRFMTDRQAPVQQ
jgi:dCMP deaminase